jgi:alpha-methylacyl-CoA racemase
MRAIPKLVYGRVTGWGQHGPLAQAAGHDINYIALTGMLHAMGRAGAPPSPPLNLVGDFGGGAMMLAFGVVCAALEARASGKGQVVDAAMTDGAALLGAMMYGFRAYGVERRARGQPARRRRPFLRHLRLRRRQVRVGRRDRAAVLFPSAQAGRDR